MQMTEYPQNMQIGLLTHLCKVPGTQAHSLTVSLQEKNTGEKEAARASRKLLAREGAIGVHRKGFC